MARATGSLHDAPMTIDVRKIEPDELPKLRDVLSVAFGGGDVNPSWDPVWEHAFERDRLLAAFENGEMVGVAGSFTFTVTVPGGEIPSGGLTIVGVLPNHRRKGILRKLMTAHIEDLRAHHEPIGLLWASEEAIYQRFGYGLGTSHSKIEIERGRNAFRNDPGPSGRVRFLDEDGSVDVLPGIYDKVRRDRPGMLARSEDWWRYHRLWDPKESREGASRLYRVIWEDDTGPHAYALYRVKEKWDEDVGLNESELSVFEVLSDSPEAHREIWRYIFGIDLVQKVTGYFLAVDDPLALMLVEPRRLRTRVMDAMWLRIVDVKAALEGRGYAAEGSITFRLTDEFCPWNEATWTLTASPGAPSVAQSDADPDLALETNDLAAAYLGTLSFAQLGRAGRVRELRPGAIERADAMFRSPIAPWYPEIF